MTDWKSCNGWNYHVFPLGADKCCLCGTSRASLNGSHAPALVEASAPKPKKARKTDVVIRLPKKEVDISLALDLLCRLGCGQDPVEYDGHETTPDALGSELQNVNDLAQTLRLKFHSFEHGIRKPMVKGTLLTLLRDRAERS